MNDSARTIELRGFVGSLSPNVRISHPCGNLMPLEVRKLRWDSRYIPHAFDIDKQHYIWIWKSLYVVVNFIFYFMFR